jgi:acyl-coenzyme A synthetase/AMP-(fatty) acid ligase
MEGVVEAAVIGVPDEIFGQAIKAFIVTKDESKLNEKSVMSHCMKSLEPFMVPKYVEFRNALPKSTSGKIDKKNLS